MQLGIVAVYALSRPGSAVSAEAGKVQTCAAAMIRLFERSDALVGRKTAVMAELRTLASSHAEPGWDGLEAAPVDRRAIEAATAFVRAMPDDSPLPEVGVDPDGAVALDWLPSRHRLLSVSFAGDGNRLAYAWVDGSDRGSAVARFDGNSVPHRLLRAILDITSPHGDAVVRPA